MPDFLQKRSVSLRGHRTSVALEPEFWAVLETQAAVRGVSLAALLMELDETRQARPLASACRITALALSLRTAPSIRDP